MRKKYKKFKKLLNNALIKIIAIYLIIVIINLHLPQYSLASALDMSNNVEDQTSLLTENFNYNVRLPIIPDKQPTNVVKLWLTAYNSHISQTDGNPCNTAFNFNLCEHNEEDVVATNYLYLSYGAKIKIPELFGDKVFTVVDRMNPKFQATIDVWMKDYQSAVKFGRKFTVVEIY